MELTNDFKKTEVGSIPKDWSVASIGDVCTIKVGRDLYEDRYSQISDHKFRYPIFSNTVSDYGLYGYYNFAEYEGDAVTVVGRGVGLGRAFPRSGGFGAIGRLLVLFPNHTVKNHFLSSYINNRITIFNESGGIPQLTGVSFSKYKFPVPPAKEQEAIANALSDADAHIESLEKLIAKKRLIKKGVMQELLTGTRRLTSFTKKWSEVTLSEHAVFFKGKGLPKSALSEGARYPCVHYGELFTQYKETIKAIKSATDSKTDSFLSQPNDVLMPTSDVTPRGLAKASCITVPDVVLGGDILVIRPSKYLSGSFLSYVIRFSEPQILQLVSGSTVFHIYATDMKKFRFSLPELAEQKEIVTILDDLEQDIASFEKRLTKARLLKQGMMQELLTGRIRLK